MSEPPEAARRLVLELVRPQVEAGSCPGCGARLSGGGLEVEEVQPDRIDVTATCPECGRRTELRLRPAADGGSASVR